MNSFVATNWLHAGNTMSTAGLFSRYPCAFVPGHACSQSGSVRHSQVGRGSDGHAEYVECRTTLPWLRLTEEEFSHVLGTFPLIATEAKTRALTAFVEMMGFEAGVR